MLMKLSPGVKFTNILCTAFALVDPERVKNTVKSSVSFMLLGSTSIKAVQRMLVKLSPDRNYFSMLFEVISSALHFFSIFAELNEGGSLVKAVSDFLNR
jgi:hypothetical protein